MGNILKRYTGTNWETVSGAITGDTLPVGSIVAYSSNNAPTNWLICDGSAVNRVTYADLFSVIGTTYGAGDGTTTFNLPNAKGRVITGLDSSQTEFNAMGKTGGEKTHQLTVNEMPSHSHNLNGFNAGGIGTGAPALSGSDENLAKTNDIGPKGGDQAHNNLQPYITENIIIKAFQSSGVVADVVQANTVSDTDTYSCNYINDLNTYSTDEIVIGKWIDGKPIYRKVITFTFPATSPSDFIVAPLSNVAEIVSLRGIANYAFPFPSSWNMKFDIGLRYNGTKISGRLNWGDYTSKPALVIVDYTKTTD